MALTAAQVRTQLAKAQAFCPNATVSVVFDSTTVTGTRANADITQVTEDVGTWLQYRFSVLVNRGAWASAPGATPPGSLDDVVIGGVTYLVLAVTDDPLEALRTLHLGEDDA